MGFTLLDHWKDAGRPAVYAKVYRFLVFFYGDRATQIAFPLRRFPAPQPPLELEPKLKSPRSPQQIRQLLIQVSEAVAASRSVARW